MNIIFVGLMFSEQSLSQAHRYSKCGVQMSVHKFQTNLLSGLESCEDVRVDVVNVLPVGSYPVHYKKLFIKNRRWGRDNLEIGFINLPLIKRIRQKRAIIKYIERKIKEYGAEDTRVIFYYIFRPFLECAEILKKKHPQLKTYAIMTDPLPGRDDRAVRASEKAVKEGDALVALAKCLDGFVLLTEQMKEPLKVGSRPYTVIECIADTTQPASRVSSVSEKRFLYTGTVAEEFGIKDLADAFVGLDGASLTVCGVGDSAEYLRKLSEENDNINYLGFVDQKEISRLRDECDFLVNPRRPSGTYTKYSFPSKTAEYMMSGKPVVMYKLEGVPDEYDEYLWYLSADESAGIRRELKKITEYDYSEHAHRGMMGREFVKRNKGARAQAEKLVRLLK